MDLYTACRNALDEMGISYRMVEHPPAWTAKDADVFIKDEEGVKTKTLFLCNKKSKDYYLVVLDGSKSMNMKLLESLIPTKGLHFCSEEKMMEKLGVTPGTVSIFGLLNNEEHDIQVILDKAMMDETYIAFHPNVNTVTAFITMEDMFRFLEKTGYEYRMLEL